MNWIGTTEAAKILRISDARVRQLLADGRIKGACKVGRYWMIPLFDGKPSIQKGTRGPKPRWTSARAKAKTKIYINRSKLAQNHSKNTFEPVISVNRSDRNLYGHEVAIDGACRIIYQPEREKNPRIWIETFSQVRVINFEEKSYSELCNHLL
jgi:excisionase family DNA binding protein